LQDAGSAAVCSRKAFHDHANHRQPSFIGAQR